MLQCWIQVPNQYGNGKGMCRCICAYNPVTALMQGEDSYGSRLPPFLSEICSQTAFYLLWKIRTSWKLKHDGNYLPQVEREKTNKKTHLFSVK